VREHVVSGQSWLGTLDQTTVIDELVCLSVEEAMQLIQELIYRPAGTIVCVVRLSGTFDNAMLSLPEGASVPLQLTHAQLVFDAITGNLLIYSVGE